MCIQKIGEFGAKDLDNPYNKLFRRPLEETMMLNLVQKWESGEYRFDWLLSILVVVTWFRLLFSLRISKRLGPLFKVI